WGVVVLTPLFFLYDISGRQYAPPTEYPHFFYGFFSIAMAWQIAFLMIGSDPVRFRPLMIPSMIEKFGFVLIAAVLYARAAISPADASGAVADLLLGALFVAAFARTSSRQTREKNGEARSLLR